MECTSCGWPTADLTTVHRVYLRAGDAPGEPAYTVLDAVEQWCVSCRSHYPHQLADT